MWCPTALISFKSIGGSVFKLESGNQNVYGRTDRQTDVGHINLIGGLHATYPINQESQSKLRPG